MTPNNSDDSLKHMNSQLLQTKAAKRQRKESFKNNSNNNNIIMTKQQQTTANNIENDHHQRHHHDNHNGKLNPNDLNHLQLSEVYHHYHLKPNSTSAKITTEYHPKPIMVSLSSNTNQNNEQQTKQNLLVPSNSFSSHQSKNSGRSVVSPILSTICSWVLVFFTVLLLLGLSFGVGFMVCKSKLNFVLFC